MKKLEIDGVTIAFVADEIAEKIKSCDHGYIRQMVINVTDRDCGDIHEHIECPLILHKTHKKDEKGNNQ